MSKVKKYSKASFLDGIGLAFDLFGPSYEDDELLSESIGPVKSGDAFIDAQAKIEGAFRIVGDGIRLSMNKVDEGIHAQ